MTAPSDIRDERRAIEKYISLRNFDSSHFSIERRVCDCFCQAVICYLYALGRSHARTTHECAPMWMPNVDDEILELWWMTKTLRYKWISCLILSYFELHTFQHKQNICWAVRARWEANLFKLQRIIAAENAIHFDCRTKFGVFLTCHSHWQWIFLFSAKRFHGQWISFVFCHYTLNINRMNMRLIEWLIGHNNTHAHVTRVSSTGQIQRDKAKKPYVAWILTWKMHISCKCVTRPHKKGTQSETFRIAYVSINIHMFVLL